MKLTVNERLMVMGMLPKEGDFATWKIIRNLRTGCGFDEEELAALDLKHEGESIHWKVEGVPAEILNKEIPIGPRAVKLIAEILEKMNTDKKLTEQHFSLYEKFCEPEETSDA